MLSSKLRTREKMQLYSSFEIVVLNDAMIVLTDLDIGRSVTNDADNVIDCLSQIISGGIGQRSVYYRDTGLRYDRMLIEAGLFSGFRSCTAQQQDFFRQLADQAPALWTVYGGDTGDVRVVSANQSLR